MTNTKSKTTTFYDTAVIATSVLILTAITAANAESPLMAPAPAPALDCMTVVLNMSDCLSFVLKGSNLTKPDEPCCGEFAGLVESNPICLCELLGNPGSTGVELDLGKAMKLPKVCGVSTPPVSLCSAFGVPVSAPTPAGSEADTPTASEGPGVSFGPSTSGPIPGSNGNGVSSTAVFDMTIFIGLAIAFITLSL